MEHSTIGLDEIHIAHNWEFANAAARAGATGLVVGDVGKLALQTDTGAMYRLTDHSPVTWADQVGLNLHAATAKTTPVDADTFGGIDSAASNVLTRFTWANIKTTLATWLTTLTATWSNKTLTNPVITNYVETLYAPSAGTAFTVDLANGTYQKFTTSGNITITLPSSVAGKSYLIEIAYGGTHTVTWAGGTSIKWPGNIAPTATSVNAKSDLFAFTCDGSVTKGRSAGANF